MFPHSFSPSIQPLFQTLISSEEPVERIQAAYKLSAQKDKEEAREALIRGLIIPDPDLKLAILDIFLQPDFLDTRISASLITLLKDSNSEVRENAVSILGTLKDTSAIDSLINSLNAEKDDEVRYTIMAALANIGQKFVVKDLSKFVLSENWRDRYYAVDAIGMLGNFESIPILLQAFQDPHPKVRENAILSVGHFNTSEVQGHLLELLEDEEIDVQAAAAFMLGEFKSLQAVPMLLDFLKSDIEDLILISIEALAKIKDESSVPGLIKLLNHSSKNISVAAQEALDVFSNMTILEPLIFALKDDVIIKYIEHRLKLQPEKDDSPKNKTKKLVAKLNLPIWVEMLLYEVLIENKKRI